MIAADRLQAARSCFLRACLLDVEVRKPGNVSRASPGHGMSAAQFLASAHAAVEPLLRPGLAVGDRIEQAVAASWRAAGCNTNLGIVLLCAPIAAAFEQLPSPCSLDALRSALTQVLEELSVSDAASAYRAIVQANPGGLGRTDTGDVHEAPSIDLREAMTLAADRDCVALQYASAFADLFTAVEELSSRGSPPLFPRFSPQSPASSPLSGQSESVPPELHEIETVQTIFLRYLAAWPDSHIQRKMGQACAVSVQDQAKRWLEQEPPPWDASPRFAAWDASLKAAGINPGTAADLTVATLFIAGLSEQ